MKIQMVTASAATGTDGWLPVEEALAGLGRTRQVMPRTWVVSTSAGEREVMAQVLTRCGDGVDVVVVRLDLGGYAAHLAAGGSLRDGWDDTTAAAPGAR